jgi:hypothetical protein
MTEMAIVFATAVTVVFGLNWWERQRRPKRVRRGCSHRSADESV